MLVALLLGKTATARERGVTLRVEPGARLCAGFPPTELATIVGNLVDNALDALGPDREGTVTVALHDDGETATIVVADDGPGLPDLDVFAPGVTTKPRRPGRPRPRPVAGAPVGDRAGRDRRGRQRRRRGVHRHAAARRDGRAR